MRRLHTALAATAAGLLIAACGGNDKATGPAPSSSSAASTTTTPSKPPVAQPALDGLLLTPDELNTAMNVTGMAVQPGGNATAMQSDYDKKWPPECFFASSSAEDVAYANSGFTTVRLQTDGTPPPQDQSVPPSSATMGVVLFPSATEANALFTASAQKWAACSDRQWTVPPDSPNDPNQQFQTKPLSNAGGVLSLTVTGTISGAGINTAMTCQRALTVRNNAAIDINACGKDPGDTAVTIANLIAGKVDKL